MGVRFHLKLLGACNLVDAATGVETEFRSRKSRCLLGLLALWPGGVISREKLASFLWDPAPEEQARSSLRQCLKEIRETLGADADNLLQANRLDVRLVAGALSSDAADLQSGLPAAKGDRAMARRLAGLWQGELFGDIIPAAPMFEAWVQVERARLRSLISGLLTDHLQSMSAARDFSVPDIAEELVRIEPSHELAYQYLMRFYAARGDQAGALRQHARLSQVLADELDSEPSQETVDLLVAIKRGDNFAAPAAAVPAAPPVRSRVADQHGGIPRIAIRPPLSNGASGSDYLTEGFGNQLRVCMSKFRSWIVLPWPHQGFESRSRIDFQALGQAIGVDYVIDPAFDWRQRDAELVVTLVDCHDGSEVWTEIFKVAETDIQPVSNVVAGRMAARLASRVDHMSLVRFARSTTADAGAYDLWLRGHQLSRSWDIDSDIQAQELFAQSIERDPGLACAYASLTATMMTQCMIRPGHPFTAAESRKCYELAQRAVSLDPFDARNHLSMAWICLMRGLTGRAESHFKLAAELNPFDADTLISCAMGTAFLGDLAVAQGWSRTAFDLNPLHPDYYCAYQAAIAFLDGDYRDTIAWYSRCDGLFPDAWAWKASAYALLGDSGLAVEAVESFLDQVRRAWEGTGPPEWDAILQWLNSSIPIHWKPGRQYFLAGLQQARDAVHG